MKAQVTKRGLLDMQVCVPLAWIDEEVIGFANFQNLSGTSTGWQIRRTGDPALSGDPERVACEEREGFVHVMLDA